MPAKHFLTAALVCAFTTAAHATIENLTNWDFYRDPPSPPTAAQINASTGTALSNLAELNFTDDVDFPAGYDIGYNSVNANTIAQATSGYYFSTAEDFTIRMHFTLDLTNPNGLIGLGLGIGEDRAGVNSVGIGFAVATGGIGTLPGYAGALTDSTGRSISALAIPVPVASTYSGSLTVAYHASTGDVTVGAATGLGGAEPLPPTATKTFTAGEFANWNGDDKLLVNFFIRSDTQLGFNNWTGQSANADFFDFTVVQGTPTQVPEPASLALAGAGLGLIVRRRR